jgi:hypothetical protein
MHAPSILAAATLAFASPLVATSHAADDPDRHDEFGLKPDDGSDKELSLPDPVLDRNWPAPKPGDDTHPPRVAPDEDEIDPFKDDDAPPPPVKGLPPLPEEPPKGAERASDENLHELMPSPSGEIDPEVDEPSDLEDEDRAPSPLERGDSDYDNETKDPKDW